MPLKDIQDKGSIEGWFPLEYNDKRGGDIYLKLEFQPTQTEVKPTATNVKLWIGSWNVGNAQPPQSEGFGNVHNHVCVFRLQKSESLF